jgi:hypothetical protein
MLRSSSTSRRSAGSATPGSAKKSSPETPTPWRVSNVARRFFSALNESRSFGTGSCGDTRASGASRMFRNERPRHRV